MIGAIVIAALLAGPVAAENRESHTSIPPSLLPESVNNMLMLRNLDLIFRDIGNNKNPGNDAMRHARNALLSQLLKGSPDLKQSAEQLAKQYGINEDSLRRLMEQSDVARKQSLTRWPPPNGQPPENNAESRAVGERLSDTLRRLNLDKLTRHLEKSPAYQDAINQMARGDQLPPGPFTVEHLESALHHLEEFIDQIQQRLPESMRGMPAFDFRPPDLRRGISLLPRSFFSPSSWFDVAQSAIIVIALGAGVWFLIHLTFQPRRRRRGNGRHFTLMDPDNVTTREDLICAFERLALVFFGTDAEHWHHRLIAQRLGEKTSAQVEADLLAVMYEQARYAPDATGIDWRTGREPLRRLSRSRQ